MVVECPLCGCCDVVPGVVKFFVGGGVDMMTLAALHISGVLQYHHRTKLFCASF